MTFLCAACNKVASFLRLEYEYTRTCTANSELEVGGITSIVCRKCIECCMVWAQNPKQLLMSPHGDVPTGHGLCQGVVNVFYDSLVYARQHTVISRYKPSTSRFLFSCSELARTVCHDMTVLYGTGPALYFEMLSATKRISFLAQIRRTCDKEQQKSHTSD